MYDWLSFDARGDSEVLRDADFVQEAQNLEISRLSCYIINAILVRFRSASGDILKWKLVLIARYFDLPLVQCNNLFAKVPDISRLLDM
jgi:hypothetical protein